MSVLFEFAVGAVAEGGVAGMFAHAPGNGVGGVDGHLLRPKPGSFVGTVAKRLLLRAPACAPPILARLHLLHDRGPLANDGFGHTGKFPALFGWSQRCIAAPDAVPSFEFWVSGFGFGVWTRGGTSPLTLALSPDGGEGRTDGEM